MKKKLYSIYDTVACVYNNPFTEVNDPSAIRVFKEAATDKPHINDYELYCVGVFYDVTGDINLPGEKFEVTRLITGKEITASLADTQSHE